MSIDRSHPATESARPTAGRSAHLRTHGVIVLLTVAITALAVPAWRHLREEPPSPPLPVRLALATVEDLAIGAESEHPFGLVLAPDGRRVAFPGGRPGGLRILVRDLTTGETQAVPGTEGGVLPFWSPDGRHLGFFAGGRLRALTLETTEVADLAEAPSPRGGAWQKDGDIVFAPRADDGLFRRRASNGTVEPFTRLEMAAGEVSHRLPVLLNDGHHVLFFVRSSEAARGGIWVTPLDDPTARARVADSNASALAAGDWILFTRDEALVAQQLEGRPSGGSSVRPSMLLGRPVLLGTPVGRGPIDQLFATVAGDILIYGAPRSTLRELRWFDRQGAQLGTIGSAAEAWDLRISPTESSVAVAQVDQQLGTLDIWAYDGDRPLPRRLSSALDGDEDVVWSHDGTRLAWVSGRRTVRMRGALAQLPEDTLRTFQVPVRLWDWSPDGQWIVIGRSSQATRDDLWLLPAAGDAQPKPYAQSPFNEMQSVVSPDGRWLAYASDESGQLEVYVDSFPVAGRRGRLTSGGGSDPRWRADGAELFYRRGTEVHALTPHFGADRPEALSSTRLFDAGADVRAYDVSPDGRRFLLNLPTAGVAERPITVLMNWQTLLRSDRRNARDRE